MKRSHFLLFLLSPMVAFGKKAKPTKRQVVSLGDDGPLDWEYHNGLYAVTIAGDSLDLEGTQAVLVGPEFPSGVRLIRCVETLAQYQAELIRIVDGLANS